MPRVVQIGEKLVSMEQPVYRLNISAPLNPLLVMVLSGFIQVKKLQWKD